MLHRRCTTTQHLRRLVKWPCCKAVIPITCFSARRAYSNRRLHDRLEQRLFIAPYTPHDALAFLCDGFPDYESDTALQHALHVIDGNACFLPPATVLTLMQYMTFPALTSCIGTYDILHGSNNASNDTSSRCPLHVSLMRAYTARLALHTLDLTLVECVVAYLRRLIASLHQPDCSHNDSLSHIPHMVATLVEFCATRPGQEAMSHRAERVIHDVVHSALQAYFAYHTSSESKCASEVMFVAFSWNVLRLRVAPEASEDMEHNIDAAYSASQAALLTTLSDLTSKATSERQGTIQASHATLDNDTILHVITALLTSVPITTAHATQPARDIPALQPVLLRMLRRLMDVTLHMEQTTSGEKRHAAYTSLLRSCHVVALQWLVWHTASTAQPDCHAANTQLSEEVQCTLRYFVQKVILAADDTALAALGETNWMRLVDVLHVYHTSLRISHNNLDKAEHATRLAELRLAMQRVLSVGMRRLLMCTLQPTLYATAMKGDNNTQDPALSYEYVTVLLHVWHAWPTQECGWPTLSQLLRIITAEDGYGKAPMMSLQNYIDNTVKSAWLRALDATDGGDTLPLLVCLDTLAQLPHVTNSVSCREARQSGVSCEHTLSDDVCRAMLHVCMGRLCSLRASDLADLANTRSVTKGPFGLRHRYRALPVKDETHCTARWIERYNTFVPAVLAFCAIHGGLLPLPLPCPSLTSDSNMTTSTEQEAWNVMDDVCCATLRNTVRDALHCPAPEQRRVVEQTMIGQLASSCATLHMAVEYVTHGYNDDLGASSEESVEETKDTDVWTAVHDMPFLLAVCGLPVTLMSSSVILSRYVWHTCASLCAREQNTLSGSHSIVQAFYASCTPRCGTLQALNEWRAQHAVYRVTFLLAEYFALSTAHRSAMAAQRYVICAPTDHVCASAKGDSAMCGQESVCEWDLQASWAALRAIHLALRAYASKQSSQTRMHTTKSSHDHVWAGVARVLEERGAAGDFAVTVDKLRAWYEQWCGLSLSHEEAERHYETRTSSNMSCAFTPRQAYELLYVLLQQPLVTFLTLPCHFLLTLWHSAYNSFAEQTPPTNTSSCCTNICHTVARLDELMTWYAMLQLALHVERLHDFVLRYSPPFALHGMAAASTLDAAFAYLDSRCAEYELHIAEASTPQTSQTVGTVPDDLSDAILQTAMTLLTCASSRQAMPRLRRLWTTTTNTKNNENKTSSSDVVHDVMQRACTLAAQLVAS